ncbi:MAG TPA: zinc ABC transporter substrate-binding protein [Candidatus Izemoplasmatales bacterium]|nr:zinc ABC transporter substrate-binding protein [Candidatus Izemoplasmatales bacterium]
MYKKIITAMALLLTSFLFLACSDTTVEYDVYVTVYPLQYVNEQIMEGTGLTVGIVPGVTSHSDSVDWSPKEIIAMTKASYLFYVGANYDQYIDLQIESIFNNQNVELVKLENETDYIQFIPGIYHEHDEDGAEIEDSGLLGIDPHFWISPIRVMEAAALIYDKLVAFYPEYYATMSANYLALYTELQTLSDDFQTVLDIQEKPILTSTNIYGYLKNDYGLSYIPISPGYHEETEQFTTQEKEEIVDEAIYYGIHHVFFEKNVTSPLSNAVFIALEESYGTIPIKFEFDILQTLTASDRDAGKNYISIMYENLSMIIEATDYQAHAGLE